MGEKKVTLDDAEVSCDLRGHNITSCLKEQILAASEKGKKMFFGINDVYFNVKESLRRNSVCVQSLLHPVTLPSARSSLHPVLENGFVLTRSPFPV